VQPRRARIEEQQMRAIFWPRIATEWGSEVLPTGGATGPWVGIQVG
jgi:hypothetical protein